MITFLAPASRWALALLASVKKPVDSTTTSTPSSPQGRLPGSRSCSTFSGLPSTIMPSSVTSILSKARPCTESYFKRWAMVGMSPRSFTATTSMSGSLNMAR